MPNIAHYPGHCVDGLIWMAEQGHLFGPDMCGERRTTWDDVCQSFRLGMVFATQTVRLFAAEVLPRGAMYELQDATYDPVANRTTAEFKPKVNPLENVRYHGGVERPDEEPIIPGRPSRHARKDKVRGR